VCAELAAVEEVAWQNYVGKRKAPRTVKAGPGFADPDYDLSIEWKQTHDRLLGAEAKLRLGIAYAKAGKKDDALKTLGEVKAGGGLSDLAKYWTILINHPTGAAGFPAK
jgi:hypothetical protein